MRTGQKLPCNPSSQLVITFLLPIAESDDVYFFQNPLKGSAALNC